MATRFAGDFFGVALVSPGEERESSLESYFPELASRLTTKKQPTTGEETDEARMYGGAKAVSPFVGFKTFEKPDSQTKRAAPLFTGFKTLEQPTK
jgi:hypothetical protein